MQDRSPLFEVPELPDLMEEYLEKFPEMKDFKKDKDQKVVSNLVLQAR